VPIAPRSGARAAPSSRPWRRFAPSSTGAKTRERYAEIVEKHIIPHLRPVELQKLEATRIDTFYSHLRSAGRRDGKGGLAPQMVQHIHRLLSQILSSAVKAQKLRQSPMAAIQTTQRFGATKCRC
jgi:hypothetical protein